MGLNAVTEGVVEENNGAVEEADAEALPRMEAGEAAVEDEEPKFYVDERGRKHKKIKGVKKGFGVAALTVVYVTIFLDVFAWGFLNPVLPYIVEAFVDDHGDVGLLNGLVGASYSLAQMIGAFVLGSMSDKLGRRPILLVCLLMSGLSLAATVVTDSVWSLTVVRSFAGLFAGSLPIGITYIGDVVEPAARPKFMGYVGFAVSLGLVAGPAVGGALSQKEFYFYFCSLYQSCCEPGTAACFPNATITSDLDMALLGSSNATSLPACTCMKYGASSLVAAGLNVLNFILALIYAKESRPRISAEERAAAARSAAAVRMSPARTYGFVIGYAAVFLANFSFCVWDAQVPLFYKSAWFPDPMATGWESAATWNGVGFAVFGVIMSGMQFFLSARVIKCIGVRNTLFGGSFLRGLAFYACLWMPSGGLGVMIGLVLVAATGSLNFSGFQVMAANMAPPQIMGRMMGLMQTIIALARASAPIAGGLVYDWDNETSFLVDNLGINSTHDHQDDGLGIFVFAGTGMIITAAVLLLMPRMPIKDTDKPTPFCCAGTAAGKVTHELSDPLMDSGSDDDEEDEDAAAAAAPVTSGQEMNIADAGHDHHHHHHHHDQAHGDHTRAAAGAAAADSGAAYEPPSLVVAAAGRRAEGGNRAQGGKPSQGSFAAGTDGGAGSDDFESIDSSESGR